MSSGPRALWSAATGRRCAGWGLVGLVGLGTFPGLMTGCDWRKPLPHRPDAGPPVQLVDTQGKAAGNGGPAAGAAGRTPSAHSTSLFLIEEHEPNDDPEHAQPILSGRGVRASLAPPTSLGAGKGADDYYLVTATAAAGTQLLGLTLTTGPQVDVQLDIYGAGGAGQRTVGGKPSSLWHIDERGPGQGERVTALAVRPGQSLLVRVRGALVPPKPGEASAAGAASLDYQLSVTQAAAPMGSEVEPNDTYETACPADGSDLSGTLTGRGDEDFFAVHLADALYRRGQAGTEDGAAAAGLRAAPGLKTEAILRVEVRSPGVVPALRVWVEPESGTGARPSDADAGTRSDAPTAAGPAVSFGKLRFLGDFVAGKGQSELRLRNLPLSRGSARAFVSVRSIGASSGAASMDGGSGRALAGDSRYSLRITVEPPLEGAESEPNDDCEQASPFPLVSRGSTAGAAGMVQEGQLAGFLWPGDVDCYRIPGKPESAPGSTSPTASARVWTIKLAVPGTGADCDAAAEIIKAPTTEVLPSPAADAASGTGKLLLLRAKGDAWVRVSSRERGCSQAPYLITVSSSTGAP